MSSGQNHDERVMELDVLRGFAAVAVMLYHYTVRLTQLYPSLPPAAARLPCGFFGVEFFFCISGFVIFMTLDRTRRPMDFVVSRVARLWPAYLAAMTVTFCAVRLIGLPGREVSALHALANVTMLGELLHVPLIDPAYWSLQVELIFYCWMLLAFTLGVLPRARLLLSLSLVPPMVYAAARALFHREPSYLAGVLLMVEHVPYFAIGMAAYRIRKAGSTAHIRQSSGELLIMAAATVVAAVCLSPAKGVVAAFSAAVFYAVATGRLRWIARGPLVFLGTISYTLYLIHQNIGYIVIRTAAKLGIGTNAGIGLAIGLAIALAAAITFTIERPARNWIRARYRAMRSAQADRTAGSTASAAR
jgi:peptidoglycan/LPS O-acetylase OafA/YrhL